MAYNEDLAARVRGLLGERPALSERNMFGGLCLMTGGNMFLGVIGEDLMVRVGVDAYEEALARPGVRLMDFAGRPMAGMVYVGPQGTRDDAALSAWVEQAFAFASAMPAKAPKAPRARKAAGSSRGRRSD
jgi:TfoX/Sxy family transcriptional regulator of competence genes